MVIVRRTVAVWVSLTKLVWVLLISLVRVDVSRSVEVVLAIDVEVMRAVPVLVDELGKEVSRTAAAVIAITIIAPKTTASSAVESALRDFAPPRFRVRRSIISARRACASAAPYLGLGHQFSSPRRALRFPESGEE